MNNIIIVLLVALIIVVMFAILMRALYFASITKMDAMMKEMEATLLLLTSDAIAACGEAEQKKTELRIREDQQHKPVIIDYPRIGVYQETYYTERAPEYIMRDTLN